MKKFSVSSMIVLAVLALGAPAMAQTTTPKPPPTYEQVIVNTLEEPAQQDPEHGEGHGLSRCQAQL